MTEVSSFVRRTGYYRRFVEGFSTIVAPLTRLTRQGVPFMWSEECELSFQRLKELLTATYILTLPVEGEGAWEGPSVDSVPVVREYADMFPTDLLGLPIERDIDCNSNVYSEPS
ncbi:hypothetical protein MTR67_004015 [Solanum verrucosum]|uniref:Reverse transcriptase/retrotransposon-derived protein RNase H-like domain-containing protein n=1 Tax=Solanum verrucosum TaxID=315347 RepID=A0AAF0TEN9_SOLVR|nr:hypothetical protein MTR67_004015 [Solanum verrucosum]